MIDRKDVEHVARLTRLALTDAELERMREQLNSILAHLDTLGAVPTEGGGAPAREAREAELVPRSPAHAPRRADRGRRADLARGGRGQRDARGRGRAVP